MDAGSDPNIPNLEQLMQLGIQAARRGNKQNARVIFQQILDADKQNERAWLWMAAVAETPEDRLRFLNTVLRINPYHATALRELDKIKRKQVSRTTRTLRYGLIGLMVLLAIIACGVTILVVAG